jgi:hypothetical protein
MQNLGLRGGPFLGLACLRAALRLWDVALRTLRSHRSLNRASCIIWELFATAVITELPCMAY